ncbi:hypothetical protein BV898_08314 [Hypsibius exemplaris]|uniref:Uncharacterized protein n=1 Tax=Hypsibius exemplaris TaxID=2072580 RepID=A0A1W0WQW3_HYPEX|nr:hypothetical protein BV898_08314 [Hypsibius exemplaris]
MDVWKEQLQMDHEHFQRRSGWTVTWQGLPVFNGDHTNVPLHSPELYVIWNEKVKFLTAAAKDNPFGSDYFLWTDIGSFRSQRAAKNLITYPDPVRVATELGESKVFFLEVYPFSSADRALNPVSGLPERDFRLDIRLGGGIFGGHVKALARYDAVYYETMGRMATAGRFVGKDQNVMSSVAVMYPDLVRLVAGGGDWWYGQFFFSQLADCDAFRVFMCPLACHICDS